MIYGVRRKLLHLGGAGLVAILLGVAMVASPAEASAAAQVSNPCPNYAIQNVFDDPSSDWDRDRVPNGTELEYGTNPCVPQPASYCVRNASLCTSHYVSAPKCVYGTYWNVHDVAADPNGDWDGDEIKNRAEADHGSNPCAHACPWPSSIDIALHPNGDWDGDGVSNSNEVYNRTNPCVNSRPSNPCPSWNQSDVRRSPSADWDGDGITNSDEARLGYNPCARTTLTNTAPQPQVPRNAFVGDPLPAGYKCPTGFPYYSARTKFCHANWVG